ncbi:Methyltransferase FkbM domain protein [Caprobacter fermentans]|nr:FkbM family methyltransferase [Caproicibacter fermentans]MVB12691.1 Methyltransferase FkbM domain protein [Caproicibacter fermentans]
MSKTNGKTDTQVDREFKALADFLSPFNEKEVQDAVERNLAFFKQNDERNYQAAIAYYNKYKLWGLYAPQYGIRELAENRAQALNGHMEDFEWLYQRLGDYRSRVILTNILYYWLMSKYPRIAQIQDHTFPQYFDLDLVRCDKNEVFVDIGAYTGDTVLSYIRTFGEDCYKRIYCYEILPADIDLIKKNVEQNKLKNVEIRNKGAADKPGTLYLNRPSDSVSSIAQLVETGDIEVPTVAIDDDIKEPVTFIKMDIEGAEEQALLGCRRQIADHHPKLALSVYHNHKDLWKLAKMIEGYDPSYRFYLRYYGNALLPTEYLLYAV